MSRNKLLIATAVAASGSGVALILYLVFRGDERDNPFREFLRSHPPATGKRSSKEKRKMLRHHLRGSNLDKVPRHFDVICIGSGLGSLTTAAMLAKTGRSVLVLEQHAKVGGSCHTFVEGPFEFDTGLHYVGNLGFSSSNFKLLEQLTEGQLTWAKMESCFDELVFGDLQSQHDDLRRFSIHGGYDKWKKHMLELFPDEENAINQYLKLIRFIKYMKIYFWALKTAPKWIAQFLVSLKILPPKSYREKYFYTSAKQVIESLTDNEDLRACLLYNWAGIAAPPGETPLYALTTVSDHFVSDGAFYPVGGPSILPFYLTQTIIKNGGHFFTKANVSEILVRKTKKDSLEAYGVLVKYGSGTNTAAQYEADLIVSGVGLHNTYLDLVPRYVLDDFCPSAKWLLEEGSPSISYFNIFVGLDSGDKELILPSRNFWVFNGPNYDELYQSWISEPDPFEALEKFGIPVMFVTFPSAKDATINSANKKGSQTCVAVTLAPYEWFKIWDNCPQRKADRNYEKLKDAFARKMWKRILQVFPYLQGKRKLLIVGSPVTHNYYLKMHKGQINGIQHNMARFTENFTIQCRAKTEIKNLFMTGQDTVFCGASGSLTAAMFTTSAILGRNVHRDLNKLYKKSV